MAALPYNAFGILNERSGENFKEAWLYMEIISCAVRDAAQGIALKLVDDNLQRIPESILREDAYEYILAAKFLTSETCDLLCQLIGVMTEGRVKTTPNDFVQRAKELAAKKQRRMHRHKRYTKPIANSDG